MAEMVRWGILGCGKIAAKFAVGLLAAEGAQLTAAGSRSREKAEAFGDEYDIPHRHGSYEELAANPEVDVIYVATPHPMHRNNMILCLQAGKPVLCEKPFTLNADEAKLVVEMARAKDLFLMEAMWSRFVPSLIRTRKLIAEGAIGEVRMVQTDLGFRATFDPKSRLFDLNLGGGALLDVGVYTVSFASMIYGGAPESVSALAHIGSTGSDENTGIVLGYPGGGLALLHASLTADTTREATIVGTEGYIKLHSPWIGGERLSLAKDRSKERIVEIPYSGNGYNLEAEEVGRCITEGKTESDAMPLDETISIMETMDTIRSQIDLTYPGE